MLLTSMTSTIFTVIITVLAVLMTVAILVQSKSAGLGAGFGGGGNVATTKRGVEKKLHNTTVVLALLFFGALLANILFA